MFLCFRELANSSFNCPTNRVDLLQFSMKRLTMAHLPGHMSCQVKYAKPFSCSILNWNISQPRHIVARPLNAYFIFAVNNVFINKNSKRLNMSRIFYLITFSLMTWTYIMAIFVYITMSIRAQVSTFKYAKANTQLIEGHIANKPNYREDRLWPIDRCSPMG